MSTGLNVLSFIAQSTDLIQSVNETIELRIGIPVFEQELYYMGEKLHSGSTLREYSIIDSDAELKLVDKRQVRDILQNPDHEEAWEELYDFVFLLDTISSEEENNEDLTDLVKETLRDYLKKTPAQFEKAENYIQIFSSSAALSELIIFCGSDIAHHNSCAENLISNLLKWSKELPPPLRRLSAPILVALCKAFSGSSPKYHLNNACRSTLGDLMVFMKLSGDRETTSTTHITLKDLNAILGNVFMDIGRDLTNKVSNRRLNHFCPLRTNVTDLKNFLLPVKNLIGEDLASYRVEDMTSLKDLLSQLIIYLGFCLSKLEELLVDFNIPVGCYEHIAVLHELSTSCQLFQGIEEILWTMLTHRKVVFCYLMINYSRRSDNHEWIYNHKEATTFECRRHLAMFLLPVVEDNSVELPQKEVERSQLWEQSLKYITEAGTDTPQAGLSLKFKDEEAIGAGVRREWFYLVCKELFGSQRDLFRACPNDRRRIFLKSASNVNLDHFKFAGRVIALALMHKVQIGIVLDRVLFLQLAEKSVSLEDIRHRA